MMTPAQIISRFEVDHYPIPVAWGGTNHPTNLDPRGKPEHRKKTNKKDIPAIAKVRRGLKRRAAEAVAKAATMIEIIESGQLTATPKKGKRKWGSRPMPGGKTDTRTRRMNGKVCLRSSPPTSK